jgi:Trk-type K+ transport systems, membrane components
MSLRREAVGRGPGRRRPLPNALRLIGGLALLVAVGSLLLYGACVGSARTLSPREAIFTAVSALTVTGLSIITPAQDLTPAAQVILLILVEIGGVGFMAAAVVAFRLMGRNVNLMDRVALRDSLGLPDLKNILLLLHRVIQGVFLLQAIGALLLWLHWFRGPLGPARAAFYAVFHAASSFCNAGFDLFDGLPEFPTGMPTDGITLLIEGMLVLLGGLGIPVLADLVTYPRNHRLSLHTRITLGVVALLTAFGMVGIFLSEGMPGGALSDLPWQRRLPLALFQAISARSAGLPGLPAFGELNPATQYILSILMYIGGAPASMGGGITTGTLVVMVLALWSFARGWEAPQIWGRRIPIVLVRKAAAVLTVSLILVPLSTWLLLLTHDTTLAQAQFEIISAFATCGMSLGLTRHLNSFGLMLVMLLMFWGRLGALTMVIAMARHVEPQRIQYPEEQVLLG